MSEGLSAGFHAQVLEGLPLPVIVFDTEGYCLFANRALWQCLGYAAEEATPQELEVHTLQQYIPLKARMASLQANGMITYRANYIRKDRGVVPVEVSARLLRGAEGGRDLVVCLARGLSAAVELEEGSTLSRKSLYHVLDMTPCSIILVDRAGNIRYTNNATLGLLGLAGKDQVLERAYHEVLCPEGQCLCPSWQWEGGIVTREGRVKTHLGGSVPVMKSEVRISAEGEALWLEALVDISRVKEAEEMIGGILETVDEGFLVIDRQYRIVSANRAFLEQTRLTRDKVLGRQCYRISHGSDVPCYELGEDCAVKHTFETGQPHTTVHIHHCHSGEPLYVETKSYPLRNTRGEITSAIEAVSNITEKRKLEAQLRQSQKMEAVGTLAGGIAHDFNNILTTILGYGELIRGGGIEEGSLRSYMDIIISSASKAARLTQSLLAFSRKQIIHPERVDLNEVVLRMQALISRLIGEHIEVNIRLHPEPLVLMADCVQLEQIIINLATNARDAMRQGGTLLMATETVTIDKQYMATHGYGRLGRYALLLVSDNGHGMDDKTLSQVFEPFFTTKAVGQGTGLGLSVVYGIIKQHMGYISVYSEPGVGSTFKILLPLLGGTEPVGLCEKHARASVRGTETVLLAEDDEVVRRLVNKILTESGYRVLVAENGEEAVEQVRNSAEEIQIMLLDMMMPRKSGLEVYREAIRIKSGLKAILMSGYPADMIDKGELPEGEVRILMKPVSPSALLLALREMLEAGC